ncbi:MAG: hypothetical protein RMJ33_08890 [Saprospiraceae bacterium]|nr:hypothetical protein [Saprospiraceae bacterium]MDW8229939.1 hypothetical protein [Saprospiraceae bacterium]
MSYIHEQSDFDWLSDVSALLAAQDAWHSGGYDRVASYQLVYRPPGLFALSCGAGLLADLARRFRFTFDIIRRLGNQTDAQGRALFTESFLNYLQRLRIRADVWAAPEGTLLLPDEPIALARGPLAHLLLLAAPMHWLLWRSTHWATLAAQQRWQSGYLAEEDPPPAPISSNSLKGWTLRALYVGASSPDEAEAFLHQNAEPQPADGEGFQPARVTFASNEGLARPLAQVRRTYRGSHPQGDIWLTRTHEETASVGKTTAHIADVRTRRHRTLHFSRFQNLYQPVLTRGYPVLPDIKPAYLRQRTLTQLRAFTPEKLADYPHGWFVETDR